MHPLVLFKRYIKHILEEFKKGKYGQKNKEAPEGYQKSTETGIPTPKDGQEKRQESRQSKNDDETERLLTLE